MPTYTISDSLAVWLKGGDRGISSNTIVEHLTGFPATEGIFGMNHPEDPGDLGRCLKLLDAVPELRPRIKEMATCSLVWKSLVEHWYELTDLYYDEYPSGRAPKCYARMRELIAAAERKKQDG